MPTHGYRIRFFLPHTNTKHSPLLLTRCTRRFSDYVGGHFFRKLWQHFPLKKKYFESLSHSISSRYSSSKKRLAFTNPVGTVWWSILPMVFPDFNTWWFICSRVNIGIFSNDVPHPVVGNSAAAVLSLTSSELVPCFCFLRLYILCGSRSMICLSLPLRMYSYTRFTTGRPHNRFV